jgi:hypothetical protein
MNFLIASLPIIIWLVFMILFSIRNKQRMEKLEDRYTEPDLLFKFFSKQLGKNQYRLMKNYLIVLFLTLIITMILSVFSFAIVFIML